MMPSLSSAVENFVSLRSNSQTVDAFLQLLLLSPLRPPSDPKHALDKTILLSQTETLMTIARHILT